MTSLLIGPSGRHLDFLVCNKTIAVNVPAFYGGHVPRSALSTVANTVADSMFCLKHLYVIQILFLSTIFTVSFTERLLKGIQV